MKRVISLVLTLALLVSCVVTTSAYSWFDSGIKTVDQAVQEYEYSIGKKVETNRYYFLMPNGKNGDKGDDDSVDEYGEPIGHYGEYAPSWYNEFTNTPCIYWWNSGVVDPAAWVGYLPSGQDEVDKNVYYADVPQEVVMIIWNNGVDNGTDHLLPIYYGGAQTINIPSECYAVGESENYPDGTDNFDNMIFVVDPDMVSINELSYKQTCAGEWYYYYGNGCYGFTEDGTHADCLRDDHFDEDGNHIGCIDEPTEETVAPTIPSEEETVAPTEPSEEETEQTVPTDEPTEPTDEPTEPTDEPTEPSVEKTEPTETPTEVPTQRPTKPAGLISEMHNYKTVDEAVAEYEDKWDEEIETNRYYFLMPNGKNGDKGDDDSVDEYGEPIGHYGEYAPSWYNEFTDAPCIYWWDSKVADPDRWPGYLPSGVDKNDPDVYYADVPQAVCFAIWNNGVDGGMDYTKEEYFHCAQTGSIGVEYYDPDESPNYPDGTENFDNMIYVIDPDLISINDFSQKQTCGGEWYYYYGNGCYGFTKDGTQADCLRDDHYDADGNHIDHIDDPTEPTVPTDEPTEPSVEKTEPTETPTEVPTQRPTKPAGLISEMHNYKTVDEAVAEYEAKWDEEIETNRYYFLMPNGENGDLGDDGYALSWYNEFTDAPCIYWWGENVADPDRWPGYLPSGVDKNDPDVYYADVPQAVCFAIWNNGVDGGMDYTKEEYFHCAQTELIGTEYYDADESPNYPDGTENFDNMIYVIDPDLISISDFSQKQTCGGEWYYYYGNGCYGFTKDGTHADCLRDDHYDADGNHIEIPQPEDFMLGDVDGDGEITIVDATTIQMHLAELKTLTEEQLKCADTDKNGEVDILDATRIQMFLAEIIEEL